MSRIKLSTALAMVVGMVSGIAPAAPAYAYPLPMKMTGSTLGNDPSLLIRSIAPKYVMYTTQFFQTRYSTDRVDWKPPVATMPVQPQWWKTDPTWGSWAPDVSFHGGKYWMYYTRSAFGLKAAKIGVAWSQSGDPGTWVDSGGPIISSDETPVANGGTPWRALDPNLFVDSNGKWFITFGSFFQGIYTIEADPNTGKPFPWAAYVKVAQRTNPPDVEAPFIIKHGANYFLFVSFDRCCKGKDSTYNIRVGRSTTGVLGPYYGKAGVDMRQGGGSMLLETHDFVIGPGGQSVVHDPNTNEDLLVYNYNDARNSSYPLTLGINRLSWDAAGWPFVN